MADEPVLMTSALNYIFQYSVESSSVQSGELEIICKGEAAETLAIELNGKAMTSSVYTDVCGKRVYRFFINAEDFWEGENFLRILAVEGNMRLITARLRDRLSDGEYKVTGGRYTDDLLFEQGDSLSTREFDFGRTILLKQVEVFFQDPAAVNLFAWNNEQWIELYGTWDENRMVFDGQDLLVNRIRMEAPGYLLPGEIRVSGSSTKDQAPDVRILFPENGNELSLADVKSKLVIGFIDNPKAMVSVNGIRAEQYGQYFWIKMKNLGFNEGDIYTITATAVDEKERTDEHMIDVIIGLPGFFTVDLPDEIIYTEIPSIAVTGHLKHHKSYAVKINGIDAEINRDSFSLDVALEDGLNLIKIQLVDGKHDRVIRTVFRKVYLYSGEVKVVIDQPQDGLCTKADTIAVSGKVSCVGPVKVWVNNKEAIVSGMCYTLEPVPLAEGTNIITVKALDARGHENTASVIVCRDTIVPVITGIHPADGYISTTSSITISGNVADLNPVWVYVNGTLAERHGELFLITETLSDGMHVIDVYAVDAAGNESDNHTFRIIVDTQPPAAFEATADPAGWTNNPQPVISFTATDAASGIDHYECSVDGSTFAAVESPYTLPAQTDGEHTVRIKAVDRAGWERIAEVKVYIDTTPPATPEAFRAIPAKEKITVQWLKTDEDIVAYRLTRYQPWENGDIIVTGEEYVDAGLEVDAFIYQIIAIDRAGNESIAGYTNVAITQLAITEYSAENGCFVEYDTMKLAVMPGSLDPKIKDIVATEIESDDLEALAINPIISPIYEILVVIEENGEKIVLPHAALDEEFLGSIVYDESLIPAGFPEENLGVYYINPITGRWRKVEHTAVDVEKNEIFFRTNHFTEFSVQPSLIEDLSPQEIKEVGYSPFKTDIKHESVSVSPQGGSCHLPHLMNNSRQRL